MDKEIRYGDFLREQNVYHNQISYNQLAPKIENDNSDVPSFRANSKKLELRSMDVYRLLAPYISVRFFEQARAVVPLAMYMALFQYFILGQKISDSLSIGAGLLAVMVGLMFFMEGLKLGLMPFGEAIGNSLPKKTGLTVVLVVSFLLGVGVTFAEPAIGALQVAGANIDFNKAPYLFALLNLYTWHLVLVVGVGVGVAAVLGTLRFIYNWSLKPLIYLSVTPTLLLTVAAFFHPELNKIIGLAWDCGGVTTGPVTVPLVLSLGIGVAAAVGQGRSSLNGFGIVTLASVFPIFGVLLLGFYISQTLSVEQIIASAQVANQASELATKTWLDQTPGLEIALGLRAIVPLVVFLFLVMAILLKEKVKEAKTVYYGIFLTVVGMIIFNLGLTYGLASLGDQAGGIIPGAFMNLESLAQSPLYSYTLGVIIAIVFAWCLGFGATLAEPALNALGMTVQNLTNGAFKKNLLMYSVAAGVAVGIAVGVAKIIFNFQLTYVLVPAYALAMLMTFLSSEEYVNIAWDSAGVTTGPVTVPLVLAMGLGFGNAVGVVEGFGILAAASIFPIISVMGCGLYVNWQKRRQAKTVMMTKDQLKGAA